MSDACEWAQRLMSLSECEVIGAVLLGRGPWSVPDPTDKIPQDENETKSSHSGRHSRVILVTPLLFEILA